ncbi:MAG: hypothetical protein LAP39_00195 [Acidobacteriia bacterium]|nr:hypothetical protein [Terriglobia bacterium]
MLRASPIVLVLAGIVSLPTAGIALRAVGITAWQMFDPCVRWDASGSTSGSLSIGPRDVCRTVTVNGQSKLRAATVTALIPGVVLLCTVLATIGVVRSRRGWIFAGAVLMLAETPLTFTIAPLTLMTGLLYLILANTGWRSRSVGEITQ